MRDVTLIDQPNQANELFKPLRLEILGQLAEPRSCPEIAKALGLTTQKVYYHVKILQGSGLVEMVRERRVRGIMEGVYQATARSIWLSPRLVKRLGGPRKATDQLSLQHLLDLTEDMQIDIGHLASRTGQDTPSLGISAQIELADDDTRAAFLAELKSTFTTLAEKYGARSTDPSPGDVFRFVLACYPQLEETEEELDQRD